MTCILLSQVMDAAVVPLGANAVSDHAQLDSVSCAVLFEACREAGRDIVGGRSSVLSPKALLWISGQTKVIRPLCCPLHMGTASLEAFGENPVPTEAATSLTSTPSPPTYTSF